MNITITAVTTTATSTTTNGFYELEYSVKESQLEKVQASIYQLPLSDNQERLQLGYIILENENLHCSLPNLPAYSAFFTDFDQFLLDIRAECEAPTEAQSTSK